MLQDARGPGFGFGALDTIPGLIRADRSGLITIAHQDRVVVETGKKRIDRIAGVKLDVSLNRQDFYCSFSAKRPSVRVVKIDSSLCVVPIKM